MLHAATQSGLHISSGYKWMMPWLCRPAIPSPKAEARSPCLYAYIKGYTVTVGAKDPDLCTVVYSMRETMLMMSVAYEVGAKGYGCIGERV